jgi:hypothetical protein
MGLCHNSSAAGGGDRKREKLNNSHSDSKNTREQMTEMNSIVPPADCMYVLVLT